VFTRRRLFSFQALFWPCEFEEVPSDMNESGVQVVGAKSMLLHVVPHLLGVFRHRIATAQPQASKSNKYR
jgi:hypothetical protein